jgi:hypothetical protein
MEMIMRRFTWSYIYIYIYIYIPSLAGMCRLIDYLCINGTVGMETPTPMYERVNILDLFGNVQSPRYRIMPVNYHIKTMSNIPLSASTGSAAGSQEWYPTFCPIWYTHQPWVSSIKRKRDMSSTKVYAKLMEYISSKHVITYQRLFSIVVAIIGYLCIKNPVILVFLPWCKKQSRLGLLNCFNQKIIGKARANVQRAFETSQWYSSNLNDVNKIKYHFVHPRLATIILDYTHSFMTN